MGRLSTPQSGGGTNHCYRCGKADHAAAACKFKTARCHNCNKKGQIATVCKKKPQNAAKPKQWKGKSPGNRGIKSVRKEESAQSSDELGLMTIRCEQGRPLVMDLTLSGKPSITELDTGAAVSLVSEKVFRSQWPECKLTSLKLPLRTYSGEPMEVLGLVEVEATYSTQLATLPLRVVKRTGPSLFGRNWLEAIRPEW